MPSATRFLTIPPTTSVAEKILGAPEQFTLMPTTSFASKKCAQASRSFFAPVSEHMPRANISRTVGSSILCAGGVHGFFRMYPHGFAGERSRHPGIRRWREPAHHPVFGKLGGSGCASARYSGELQKIATMHIFKLAQLPRAGRGQR